MHIQPCIHLRVHALAQVFLLRADDVLAGDMSVGFEVMTATPPTVHSITLICTYMQVFLLRADDVLAGDMSVGFEVVTATLPTATRSALDTSFATPSNAINTAASGGLGKVREKGSNACVCSS